jgi:hypothetical protein
MHRITLRDALNDSQLLGNELRGKSWKPWRCLLPRELSPLSV